MQCMAVVPCSRACQSVAGVEWLSMAQEHLVKCCVHAVAKQRVRAALMSVFSVQGPASASRPFGWRVS